MIRKRRVIKTISKILKELQKSKLTINELMLVLGQVLVNAGYSVHFFKEHKDESAPEKITPNEVQELYNNSPSLGSTLMKLGFDLQGDLIGEIILDIDGDKNVRK